MRSYPLLLLFATTAALGCGTAPASTPPPDGGATNDAATPAPEMLAGCTEVDDGCEQETRASKTLDVVGDVLYAADVDGLFRQRRGEREMTFVRETGGWVSDMAVANGFAFFTDDVASTDYRVRALPLDGGPARGIVEAPDGTSFGRGIVRRGDRVVWAAPAAADVTFFGVARADASGEIGHAYSNGQMTTAAVDGDDVFFGSGESLMRARASLSDASTVELWSGSRISDVVTDGANVYFTAGRTLMAVPRDGGAARKLAYPVGDRLRVHGGALYWRTLVASQPFEASYWTIPVDGGTPRRLLRRPESSGAYAVDDAWFYGVGMGKSTSKPVIVRVPLAR